MSGRERGSLRLSSRRTPGPITTNVYGLPKSVDHPAKQVPPRRMGPGVRRDDVDRYNFAFSRHHLPEVLLENLAPQSEGAGKTGCAPHPRSRRRFAIRNAAYEHTGLAEASGLPCATALRLIRSRPGDRLSCHHRRAKRLLRHDLTPAPGRRTQTISPYAERRLVMRLPRPSHPSPRL